LNRKCYPEAVALADSMLELAESGGIPPASAAVGALLAAARVLLALSQGESLARGLTMSTNLGRFRVVIGVERLPPEEAPEGPPKEQKWD
jgi:hypothetical protein